MIKNPSPIFQIAKDQDTAQLRQDLRRHAFCDVDYFLSHLFIRLIKVHIDEANSQFFKIHWLLAVNYGDGFSNPVIGTLFCHERNMKFSAAQKNLCRIIFQHIVQIFLIEHSIFHHIQITPIACALTKFLQLSLTLTNGITINSICCNTLDAENGAKLCSEIGGIAIECSDLLRLSGQIVILEPDFQF